MDEVLGPPAQRQKISHPASSANTTATSTPYKQRDDVPVDTPGQLTDNVSQDPGDHSPNPDQDMSMNPVDTLINDEMSNDDHTSDPNKTCSKIPRLPQYRTMTLM